MVEEDRLSSMDMFDRADRLMSSSMRGVGDRLLSAPAGFFTAVLQTCFSFVLLLRWLALSWSVISVYASVETFLGTALDSPSWLVKGLNSSDISVIDSFSASSFLAFVMLYLRVAGDRDALGDFFPSAGRCAP